MEFTEGEAVSIIRIQIGDLSAIRGMPDDGRDRKDRPIVRIADLKFADAGWAAAFKKRCAPK